MQQGSRIPSVEGCTPPPGGFASWDDYMRDVEDDARVDGYDPDLCELISRAMRLSPNSLVFRALLAGEDVPIDALDQHWARRYRIVKAA